jgi:CO/xanthine dehydrogenase Mo-binding subunit
MTVRDRKFNWVGQGVARVDVDEKVRGRALYVDDLEIPDCWHGCIVRSPVSHGRLKGLKKDPSFDWSQVVVAEPEDIPGLNVMVMHDRSMPLLAHDEILYLGEPLAVVAAPTLALAREAARHIHPEIEELPASFHLKDIVHRFKAGDTSWTKLCAQTLVKGDVTRGFAEADIILENEYTAGHQEQLYLEPQGLVAIPQPDGGIFIQGSMQCPYYIVHELHEALNLPPEKLRVKQTVVGGAFGGKEEFPSMLAGYCALPALKSGHPVKIIYDRNQDILFTTKRHPVWTRYKTGVKKDGTITAIQVDYLLDGGAYLTVSDVVMYRGILHSANGYRCDHVFINGMVCRTNTFPSGAFRGFGAPQAIWGLESQIDKMAAACDMAPHVFRLRNCLRQGDSTPTGQILISSVGSPAVIEKALEAARFEEKWKFCTHGEPRKKVREAADPPADSLPGGAAASRTSSLSSNTIFYGIGMSFFPHGSGFTGEGESKINAIGAVELALLEDGRPGVNIRVSSTEMGQGTHTALSQIAADALGIGMDRVRYPFADTSLVPNSGPTVASRTTMVVGSTVYAAATKLKQALIEFDRARPLGAPQQEQRTPTTEGRPTVSAVVGSRRCVGMSGVSILQSFQDAAEFEQIAQAYLSAGKPVRFEHQFQLPANVRWNQKTFEGDAYPGYSWGCNIAEVEINADTFEIKVRRVIACYDIGRVINPILAKGQLEGGLTQALGYAVMEKMGIKNGKFDADRMQTYVVPTALDTPDYDIHFVEFPYDHAEPGAKGVGEIPMDGLAPAIANAIEAATGLRMTDLPITPEKLFEAMKAKKH